MVEYFLSNLFLAISPANNGVVKFFEHVLKPLTDPMGHGLEFFHGHGVPWWLCVVVITAIVRTLLFPLTIKQVRSMRAMQELQPELKKIQAKFKDNRQKQLEEQQKLYRERGINPLGGCLPAVIQIPIFMSVYYVIREFGGLGGVPATVPSFRTGGTLWFDNLTQADPYHILPILSALTMLAATAITSKSIQPQQRILMYILPFGIMIFLWNFPAGMFMYWITNNVMTLVQNYLIYHHGPGRHIISSRITSLTRGDEEEDSENGNETSEEEKRKAAEQQARKLAKRKRRKKKK